MEYRRSLGLCGLSIRWPAVSGVGMAQNLSKLSLFHLTDLSISPGSVSSLLTFLYQSDTLFPVLTVLLESLIQHSPPHFQRECFATSIPTPTPTSTSFTDIMEIRHRVRSAILPILGTNIIHDDDILLENGLDSLGTMEVATILSATFKLRLFPTLVFNFPSISALSTYLSSVIVSHPVPAMKVQSSSLLKDYTTENPRSLSHLSLI